MSPMGRLGAYRNAPMQPPGSGSGGGLFGGNAVSFSASTSADASIGAQATGVVILLALGLVAWAHFGLR